MNPKGAYFEKSLFLYDKSTNTYRCPAGETLHYKTHSTANKMHLYTTESCSNCTLKSQCTAADKRWVSRHFYEEAFERMQKRMNSNPVFMKKRRAIVEHPFGTIKRMMGNSRFLCRGLTNVKSEMALSVMAYNFLRVLNIWGAKRLIAKLA